VPVAAGAGLVLAVAWATATLDPTGPWFALVVVWAPMTALGTVSHVVPFRLPAWFHRLRPFEHDGRVYELLGVRAAKRLLRRPPVTWFNPRLRLPATRDDRSLVRLDASMRTAEASHAISFVVTIGVVGFALVEGWWGGAAWMLAFDVVVNGYPVMLQRYNRVRLAAARAALGAAPPTAPSRSGRPGAG